MHRSYSSGVSFPRRYLAVWNLGGKTERTIDVGFPIKSVKIGYPASSKVKTQIKDGDKSNSFSENKTVKTVFNNLKPIIIYWVSVMLYFNIGLFDYFSYKTLCIIMWSAFVIFNIILGLCNKPKDVYIGMIIVELQFIICGAIILFEASKTPYVPTFVSYGNYMLAIFDNINFGKFIITILLPLTVFVGFGLKKLFDQRKHIKS